MHYYGLVLSPELDFGDVRNDVSHSPQVGAAAIRCPVGDLELLHPVTLSSLKTNIIISSFKIYAIYTLTLHWTSTSLQHDLSEM